jgi:hypothetical protein
MVTIIDHLWAVCQFKECGLRVLQWMVMCCSGQVLHMGLSQVS